MADLLDLLTIEEARAAVGLSTFDTGSDGRLAGLVTAVSRMIDVEFGAMVSRSATVVVDGASEFLSEFGSPVVLGVIRGRGRTAVTVSPWPVLSVTSIVEDGVTLSASDYRVVPNGQGRIQRRNASGLIGWASGFQNITITYQAGRYATTAAVDGRVKEAARITLRNLWRSTQLSAGDFGEYETPAANFPRFALPNAVAELLFDMRRVPGLA
jgi:hypothetical protein